MYIVLRVYLLTRDFSLVNTSCLENSSYESVQNSCTVEVNWIEQNFQLGKAYTS